MSNPADLLYTQLRAWNTANTRDTSDQRRGVGSDPWEALRRHEAALSNLRAIRELLDVAEKANLFPVQVYRAEIPEWGKMILAFPHGWSQAANFNHESLRLLSTLGPQLRQIVPPLADGSVESFEQALDIVLDALKADPTIDGEVARYLLNLVIHMKLVIEEYRLGIRGDYDLARARNTPQDHDRHRLQQLDRRQS